MKPSTDTNQRLADRMLAEGRIPVDVHAKVVAYAMLHGARIEDVLLDLGAIGEVELLKYISTMHGTKFVSTEKLYKATVDPRVIALVSPKLADSHSVFPVLYSAESHTLSVVTASPDDMVALKEVKIATDVKAVQALVARPAAIRAAIQRAYHGDPSGFVPLLQAQAQKAITQQQPVRQPQPSEPAAPGLTAHELLMQHPRALPLSIEQAKQGLGLTLADADEPATAMRSPQQNATAGAGGMITTHFPKPHGDAPPAALGAAMPAPSYHPPPTPAESDDPPTSVRKPTVPLNDHFEVIQALVNALDSNRPYLEAHSATVARWVRRLCARLGIEEVRAIGYAIAALVHDLGKDGAHHVTPLNAASSDGCRAEAEASVDVPRRFFASAQLGAETKATLRAMYERFDGRGLPMGTAGNSIPEGARILSVCDSFVDLIAHRNNPAGRTLDPPTASAYLGMHRGTLFDPAVLDALRSEIAVEHPGVLTKRSLVLLVDPDATTTSPLEVRLLEHGFDVRTARDTQNALRHLQTGGFTAVVSEVDVEAPESGLKLRASVNAQPWGKNVLLWILHSKRNEPDVQQVAFDLEVDDLIAKPSRPEAVADKVRLLMSRKASRLNA